MFSFVSPSVKEIFEVVSGTLQIQTNIFIILDSQPLKGDFIYCMPLGVSLKAFLKNLIVNNLLRKMVYLIKKANNSMRA